MKCVASVPATQRAGEVGLQPFEPGLADTVLDLRNHESIRRHMRDSAPIPRESHLRWVKENVVEERKVHLFVVLDGEEPVGIALLRDFREGGAEVGLMVVEAARRPHVCYAAAVMLGIYAFDMAGVDRLLSYVPRHNEHAFAFNKHFGFEMEGDDATYHRLVLTKECFRAHPTHRRFIDKHGLNAVVPA